jgi:hypothetical protein
MGKKEWQISFRLVIFTPYLCFRKDETVRGLSGFKLSDRVFSDFQRRFVEVFSAFEFFQVLQAGSLQLSLKIKNAILPPSIGQFKNRVTSLERERQLNVT